MPPRLRPRSLAQLLRDFENHEAYLQDAMRSSGPTVAINRCYAEKMARSYRALALLVQSRHDSAAPAPPPHQTTDEP